MAIWETPKTFCFFTAKTNKSHQRWGTWKIWPRSWEAVENEGVKNGWSAGLLALFFFFFYFLLLFGTHLEKYRQLIHFIHKVFAAIYSLCLLELPFATSVHICYSEAFKGCVFDSHIDTPIFTTQRSIHRCITLQADLSFFVQSSMQ